MIAVIRLFLHLLILFSTDKLRPHPLPAAVVSAAETMAEMLKWLKCLWGKLITFLMLIMHPASWAGAQQAAADEPVAAATEATVAAAEETTTGLAAGASAAVDAAASTTAAEGKIPCCSGDDSSKQSDKFKELRTRLKARKQERALNPLRAALQKADRPFFSEPIFRGASHLVNSFTSQRVTAPGTSDAVATSLTDARTKSELASSHVASG